MNDKANVISLGLRRRFQVIDCQSETPDTAVLEAKRKYTIAELARDKRADAFMELASVIGLQAAHDEWLLFLKGMRPSHE